MANAPDDYTITTTATHLTASSAIASAFSLQNRKRAAGANGSPVLIKSTATSSTPSDWDGAIEIEPGDGFICEYISTLWPGSTNTYLHCKAVSGTAVISFASA